MKTNKLYNILGLKPYIEPIHPKYIVIISNDHHMLFKAACNSIHQNHQKTHSVSVSNLLITEYLDNVAISYTYFKNSKEPDSLRGCNIDKLIVDKDNISTNDLYYIKSCLYPGSKEIIYIDNDSEE